MEVVPEGPVCWGRLSNEVFASLRERKGLFLHSGEKGAVSSRRVRIRKRWECLDSVLTTRWRKSEASTCGGLLRRSRPSGAGVFWRIFAREDLNSSLHQLPRFKVYLFTRWGLEGVMGDSRGANSPWSPC